MRKSAFTAKNGLKVLVVAMITIIKNFQEHIWMATWMDKINNIELEFGNFGMPMEKWSLKACIKMRLWSQKNVGILMEKVSLAIP